MFAATILSGTSSVTSAKRLLRLKPKDANSTSKVPLVDRTAKNLFVVLNELPENDDFDPESCDRFEFKMPNFHAPGRRISEIKCLEYLWKMRFYDEVLLRCIRCGIEFNYSISVIFGGHDAAPGEFPHMGAVGWKAVNGKWIFKCGATLISEKFMLTAAHCSRSPRGDTKVAEPEPKIVRLGETNILDENKNKQTPEDAIIKRFIVHPYYRSPYKYYDIAIIELETPVTFTLKSHPACIWTNQFQEVFGVAALTGWGIVEAGNEEMHPKLQVAEVDIVGVRACDIMLESRRNRHWRGLAYHQMCAGHLPGGIDSCQGDSGGPLQMKIDIPEYTDWKMHYIVGITSFGYGCGRPGTPSVYTRVSSFLNWIESIVWEEDYAKMRNGNL
ncbi:unnamed protein product [Parnassius apollo]|uniref:(apollo) hypothetical protein n=1 Tax=Parnassius apollo TaxID=110799 RepID=A0A8S3WFT0_PARAO|nr:unnamed protein product [Parnassius apollo]